MAGRPTESRTIKNARGIRTAERDCELNLAAGDWPTGAPSGWRQGNGCLQRLIRKDGKSMPRELEETILRFPSAPIHGLQRLHSHHVSLGSSENLHTLRVLRAFPQQPLKRIFLLHTGLNERDSMGLYYTLASNLVKRSGTVCIVRPFPGHLTRFPFDAFAETPLDRYLWDGSHLFRQFLRYMIETKWFLSVLARRSSYRYASGANLLAEEEDGRSRLEPDVLADAMCADWQRLRKESEKTLEASASFRRPRSPAVADPLKMPEFESSIAALRGYLGLDDEFPGHDSSEGGGATVDPAIHVIGYSLGGFTAQSVFMSWPFMISSCSTLLGGGPLRQLAPSAFAHPEEWQTVLHSLRYELDDLLMSDHTGIRNDSIAGIDSETFVFFKRTFYEVFQQDYRGSFQSRLAAFRKRMLFVVGGNDPIVRPESVLDSGPPGGINMLEIGGLSHFLDGKSETPEEEKQRDFWLPKMASLLSQFSDRASADQKRERKVTLFGSDMGMPEGSSRQFDKLAGGKEPPPKGRLAAAELLAIGPDGALPGGIFERCLDDLLDRVKSTHEKDEGVLLMLRNEIPTLLLHDSLIRERAAALYHDDYGIVRYCHGIDRRREIVRSRIDQVCLVLPWNARSIMETMDRQRGYPSQAESAGGQVRARVSDREAWKACEKECRQLTQGRGRDSIRRFDGNIRLAHGRALRRIPENLLGAAKGQVGKGTLTQVASLPDCWIWVSRDLFGRMHEKLTVKRALELFPSKVPELWGEENPDEAMLQALRDDSIRIVTVSRARYNPRFRGRLIVEPARARKLLVHVAMCLSLSDSAAEKNLSSFFH